jgi:ribosomal subunit interface protein
MELPLQLTFHGLPHSDAMADVIRRKADKLDTFFDRIVSCRVAVESPHRHKHEGHPYRIGIEVGVPGSEIVVSTTDPDAYAAVDAAFDDVARRLSDHARLRRGDVKQHEHAKHGVVAKLFGYEGYGFIRTTEGDEVYFHRNSVLHQGFERMHVGSRVRFAEVTGDDGVHASSVALLRSRTGKRPE